MTEPADSSAKLTDDGRSPLTVSPWAFGPPGREVFVGNAELLLAYLPFFLNGWPFHRLPDSDQRAMDITVIKRPDKQFAVDLRGPGALNSVFGSEFEAADGLANALVASFVARRINTLCLHASSSQIGSGIVVFLGDSMAGKSSIALHLAAAGYRLFGDDQLAVLTGEAENATGLCLGLTPKVRLPLPDDCGPRFREYVDSFTEIRDDEAAYLKLWEGEAAVFLDQLPIRAFVILNRSGPNKSVSGETALLPASRPAILKALLAQCFAPHIGAENLVPVLTALASSAAGYELNFSNSGDAASLLTSTLRNAASA